MSDIEHLIMRFMCLLVIWIPSLEKCLFKFLAHFWTGLFIFCCWDLGVLYVLGINHQSNTWSANIFLPFEGLYLSVFWCTWFDWTFMKFNLPDIFILLFAFSVISKKVLPNKMLQIIFPMFSSKNIIVLGFTFMSLIYFHKIIVYNAR